MKVQREWKGWGITVDHDFCEFSLNLGSLKLLHDIGQAN
jgi:hypothetical protein